MFLSRACAAVTTAALGSAFVGAALDMCGGYEGCVC
jgi:hypothetical protein